MGATYALILGVEDDVHFLLLSPGGEPLLISEPFETVEEALCGITAARVVGPEPDAYRLWQERETSGFTLVSRGEPLAHSPLYELEIDRDLALAQAQRSARAEALADLREPGSGATHEEWTSPTDQPNPL